ncbi:hypothetical protein Tco_0440221, partial [Tanacetum coccineum]
MLDSNHQGEEKKNAEDPGNESGNPIEGKDSEERIEMTKRSKNDQKSTRNGKKTKSQEQ